MKTKLVLGTVLAGMMFAATAPVIAADAPKTKADCEKAKDMKWDEAKKACTKK